MTRMRRSAPPSAGTQPQRAEPRGKPRAAPNSEAEPGIVHAELGPIIRSKIQPPVLRESTLTRKRLIDRLRETTQRRLTLLIAEAGYGKTTLMADFAVQTGVRTLWYRLDKTDADIITWTNHLIATLREVEPAFGQATLDLMSHVATGGPPRDAFMASVIGEMGRLETTSTVLVLDDFHAVDESDEANEFVVRLSREAPPWLSLVVSTRRRPMFEMGRLSASGEVAELGTDDLRFSREETSELFADGYGTPLEEDVLADLDEKVNGWAASLQLFHGSIRGRPASEARSLARALSGAAGPIYDFLAEEVLASLAPEIELLMLRASLLERVRPDLVVALFADGGSKPEAGVVQAWIDEADRLMLLTRSRGPGEYRQMHPLLRDVLLRVLRQRDGDAAIRQMHLRVAQAVEESQPLLAAHHYVEAGDELAAMRTLGASVMLTMGSGQWGAASELIARISSAPVEPAVAVIRARRLIEDGLIDEAAALLDHMDIATATPDVRAAVRNARLTIGWRTGNADSIVQTLADIEGDSETPKTLKAIADLFVSTSSHNPRPISLSLVGRRLMEMSDDFSSTGHDFYAAVAVHNATVTYLNAGHYAESVTAGHGALEAFGRLPFFAAEQLSTHAVLSLAYRELDRNEEARFHAREALATGREFADVPAELSFAAYISGDRENAAELLVRARLLEGQRQSDLAGTALVEAASAVQELDLDASAAAARITRPVEIPLDLGLSLGRLALFSQALLLAGRDTDALAVASAASRAAVERGAGRASARLGIVRAAASRDAVALRTAIVHAARSGELALLETAPLVIQMLPLIERLPPELTSSIEKYPQRWLPLARRALQHGNTTEGHAAASILDQYGAIEDIGLLRAYAKTYSRRGPARTLGKKLARRVSPILHIRDLGRVELAVGDRTVPLAHARRKPGSVLMYLVTRPGLSANREQIIDEIWRDADPAGGLNNLNQSLYFLRREIDPWYEDDVSVDYVHFHGDVVWLDRELVKADSLKLFEAAQRRGEIPIGELITILTAYRAQFAPEFEYEEWAMSWRSRLHATFLDVSHYLIERLARDADHSTARLVAAHALQVDDTAADVERRLVWLYARLGLTSAAKSQYAHLASLEMTDGLEPAPFDEVVSGPMPGLS